MTPVASLSAWAMPCIFVLALACRPISAAEDPLTYWDTVTIAASAPGEGPVSPIPSSIPSAEKDQGAFPLHQHPIHTAYNEGYFDEVIEEIEAFKWTNPTHARGDSIFIAKHLAVVYSASPETREKGKYYMYQLLELMPKAELRDMFVSDEIDRIFDQVRTEFLERQRVFEFHAADTVFPRGLPAQVANEAEDEESFEEDSPASLPNVPAAKPRKPFWKKPGIWLAGGAGIAAVGAFVLAGP